MVDLTTYKAQMSLICDSLNVIWADGLRDSRHPLRQLESQLFWNKATGNWSPNEAYIESAYNGHWGANRQPAGGKVLDTVPALEPAAGVIDIAAGSVGVPAEFTFSGYFLAGTLIDLQWLIDATPAGAPVTTGVSRTAEDTALMYANYISGNDNFTAWAEGAIVKCEPVAPAAAVTLNTLTVTNP